jgi:hypothetical protein
MAIMQVSSSVSSVMQRSLPGPRRRVDGVGELWITPRTVDARTRRRPDNL